MNTGQIVFAIPAPSTVKKAIELLDAPSKNTFLKSNKYNSKVAMVYLALSKKFDIFKSLSKKFDIYSKIVFRDAENFFRHQAVLVLRHPMQVLNYFVNFFLQ